MTEWVLVVISPFIVLAVIAGLVLVIAVCRARPADIPEVIRVAADLVCRLAAHAPHRTIRHLPRPPAGDTAEEPAEKEEAR